MRGMIALYPDFPRAVFKPLFANHLETSFYKLSPLHLLPHEFSKFAPSRSQLETDGMPQLGEYQESLFIKGLFTKM